MAATNDSSENFNMEEFDSLLLALTGDELDKINDFVDPEVFFFLLNWTPHVFDIQNSYLPASDRCKAQTYREATGPYDRSKLLTFLEEESKNEKDWEEQKPFVPGEKRGKVWKPPVVAQPDVVDHEDDDFLATTEWDDVLKNASETEIVELAGKFKMKFI